MKGKQLVICSLLFCGFSLFAQDGNATKVIYKWTENGLIYYSHIVPKDIKDYVKLDDRGLEIRDYTKDFETVQVVVRPQPGELKEDKSVKDKAMAKNPDSILSKDEALRSKNCEIAQKNIKSLKSGEVYDKDAEGKLVKLTAEQVKVKQENTEKDIRHFCKQ